MEDDKIIELYWARNEDALRETDEKYGAYLETVAYHILYSHEDCEECVNDTYLRAWNAMPPHRPDMLRVFLAKITRECSIDKYRRKSAKKRRATEYDCSMEELADCVSGGVTPENALEEKRLTEAINTFLREQSSDDRRMFLCRYYFFDSVRDVAQFFACTESRVKSVLHRMRKNLRAYLEKEGFEL